MTGRWRHLVTAVAATLAAAVALSVAPAPPAARGNDPLAVDDAFAVVNHYRLAAGLAPVAIDPSLHDAAQTHACWMADNDTLGHGDGRDGGSGLLSNIAVARSALFSDERFINLWFTGPYHALGFMRPGLTRAGYGTCTDDAGYYHKAASFDVLTGYRRARFSEPVVFPGDGSTTDLTEFIAETPNPLENCGWEDELSPS